MDIEQRKQNFIAVLRNAFQASDKEELYLLDSIMEENAFTGGTFWEVICPALMKDDLLTYYSNPDDFISDFNQYVFLDPEYSQAMEHLHSPLMNISANFYTPEQLEHLESNLATMKERLRKRYRHKFVINKKKLTEGSVRPILRFSKQKGITDDGGHKYPVTEKRAKLVEELWTLGQNDSISGAEFQDRLAWSSSELSGAVTAINKVFSNTFRSPHKLIQNGSGGYYLNREDFDPQAIK
jgi:hypothetical protein